MISENEITPRDLELALFSILASGCSTYAEIKAGLSEAFKDRLDPNNQTNGMQGIADSDIDSMTEEEHDQDSRKSSRLSDESLYKSLSLLRKRKLIQSGKYFNRKTRRNFTLYANTEASVEVLLRETRYRRSHIRSPYLPGKYSFWHDTDLTKVVRTIKRDGPRFSYRYGFEDEYSLRRSAEKAKKGDQFPDLKLCIKIQEGEEYFFRIEIQRHRDRVDQFALKLRDTRNNLVLCKDRRLIHDIVDTHIYLPNGALFALIDDFVCNGLFKTQWLSLECKVVGLLYCKG